MRGPRRDAAIPLGLAAGSFALALLQRPGLASSDTKIDLHVDPARFLADVSSVWTPTGSLGHVQGGQYGGYLFPMGPFFALGHALGLAPWLVQRLWLGVLLALAAWGTVRLIDALWPGPRGIPHAMAGVLMVLNPYVVVFANRTSVTLLGYAALPWLLLAVHRGVRRPRSWWWPAAFALVLTTTGGGVNAAVTAWILLAPALLVLYEATVGGVGWRPLGSFAWRTALLGVIASLWWIGPVLVQARYGIDFLQFTEQPSSIWGTSSLPEALRLMGYWVSYIGTSYEGRPRPYFGDAHVMLFDIPVVLASLLVPALALIGFVRTRRWRYGPFFLMLVLLGAAVVVAGFPEGTPLRRTLYELYDRAAGVRFLRTSYKAAPLIALGMATLSGVAAQEGWTWLRARPRRLARAGAVPLAAVAILLIALAAWPLVRGKAVDRELMWTGIPASWRAVARDLDRHMPANTRAVVLPGQLYGFYRWGGTVDPILPALTRRPVAVRNVVPYADLHAIDLLWTVDGLVQQRRLLPGQLKPLLAQLGAGAVITATDDDRARSAAVAPVAAARQIGGAGGLGRPARSYGPWRRFVPSAGEPDAPAELPAVRRYDLGTQRGIVHVDPAGPAFVVDGSAATLAGLAAFSGGPGDRPLFYAGDQSATELRREAGEGAEVVIGDSNRRRAFVTSELQQNTGATLAARGPIGRDAAVLNPFAARGTDGQTVAVLSGVSFLRAPFSPGFPQFPEHRPFAAFDGDPHTAWLADRNLNIPDRRLEVGFTHPRDVPYIDVLRQDDSRGVLEQVAVAGHRYPVHDGWTRLPVNLHGARGITIFLTHVRQPRFVNGGAGGFREVRIPGLRVREALRTPVLAESALAGRDLRRTALSYVISRTSGDEPNRRDRYAGPPEAAAVRDRRDPETAVRRLIAPPAARRWTAQAWLTVAPETPDATLDRYAATRTGGTRFNSSSRWQNEGGFRASSAFDGNAARGWIGVWVRGAPAWLSWEASRPVVIRRLRLRPPAQRVRVPTRVRVRWAGGASPALPVRGDGLVVLPQRVRARSWRLEVLAAAFPRGATSSDRRRRAVGVGEVVGTGLSSRHASARSTLRAGCAVKISVGRATLAMRPSGTAAELDAGAPLRARQCGMPVPVPAGPIVLQTAAAPFRVDLLRLRSPAPVAPRAGRRFGAGRVVSPGRFARSTITGVHVALDRPSWLVLGESYNRGWRATCQGRSLGPPRVIDAFSNGWLAPAGCRDVSFAFGPQTSVTWLYGLSGFACVLLLGLLVVRRRRRHGAPADLSDLPGDEGLAPWPLRRAIPGGLVAAAALGFMFSLRAGAVCALVLPVLLWRGARPRALCLAAGGLLGVVVPLIYALIPPHDKGGYNTQFSALRINAHWVAVGAVALLVIALWRTFEATRAPGLSTASRAPGARASSAAGRAGPGSRP